MDSTLYEFTQEICTRRGERLMDTELPQGLYTDTIPLAYVYHTVYRKGSWLVYIPHVQLLFFDHHLTEYPFWVKPVNKTITVAIVSFSVLYLWMNLLKWIQVDGHISDFIFYLRPGSENVDLVERIEKKPRSEWMVLISVLFTLYRWRIFWYLGNPL